MNESNSDPLEQLLHDWAERHTATPGSLDRIHGALRQSLESEDEPAAEDLAPSLPPARRPYRAWWLSAGVAAALLLLIVASRWLLPVHLERPEITRQNPPQQFDPKLTRITPEQLAREAALFSELDRLFGRQLQWVAETNDEVQMGIEPEVMVAEQAAESKPVKIRYTLIQRRQGELDWDVIWSANVVARNEQLVQVSPTKERSPRLLLWVFALPDGKIACDTELSLGRGRDVQVTASELLSEGDVRQIGSAEEDGVEYRVFQTVQLLSDEVI